MLAVSTLPVTNASWATTDTATSFYLVVFCYLLVCSPSCLQHYGLLGTTLGLLVGTKYPGALAVIVLLATATGEFRQRGDRGMRILGNLAANWRLWAVGGIAVIVFLASTPSILIKPEDFLESITYERARMAQMSMPLWEPSVWTRVLARFGAALGIPVAVAAGVGLVCCFLLASGRKLWPYALMIMVFVIYFGNALLPRYIILIAPLCVVLAGYALTVFRQRAKVPPSVFISVCTLAIVCNGVQTLSAMLTRYPDSRSAAARYIANYISDGSTIGFAYASEDFPSRHLWRFPKIERSRLRYVDYLEEPEYVVVSSFTSHQIIATLDSGRLSDDYEIPEEDIKHWYHQSPPSPRIFQFYDEIYSKESSYRLVKVFTPMQAVPPGPEFPSPTIEIFRRHDDV